MARVAAALPCGALVPPVASRSPVPPPSFAKTVPAVAAGPVPVRPSADTAGPVPLPRARSYLESVRSLLEDNE
jgi:hypothetical protein